MNMKREKGFTVIEAAWSMIIIASILVISISMITKSKKEIKDTPLHYYMIINYVKIAEIFYNANDNFENDLTKIFDYDGSNVLLTFEKKKYCINLQYEETVKNDIKTTTLEIKFPDELRNASRVYFDDVRLERWKYV
mgnify:FL=1